MQKALALKICAIMGIVVLLMVTLSMISGVINERHNWHQILPRAKPVIKKVGPGLVIPYNEATKLLNKNPLTNKAKQKTVKERKLVLYCRKL